MRMNLKTTRGVLAGLALAAVATVPVQAIPGGHGHGGYDGGMHSAAGARVWVPKPPVPERQATFWPTCRWVTLSPTACTTPAYSAPGTKGRGGLIWYLF